MQSNLYVIFDTKANKTTEPFSCPNDATAKRNFVMGCFASTTPPQDCVLFCVGSWKSDDDNAECFELSGGQSRVVPCTVEEIEAYFKIYQKYFDSEEVEA